jgi:hypothetical protein
MTFVQRDCDTACPGLRRRRLGQGDGIAVSAGRAPLRLFIRACAFALAVTAVAGCSRDNPQADLEAAVQTLQDSLEAKRAGEVLEQLAPDFRAQSELDREWAKRTMTVLFLQNANVKVVALTRSSRVTSKTSGETDAEVVLAGGEGLVPERVSPYSVRLHWRREGRQWRLARLEWE